jgi:hypothetical protein
VFTFLLIERGSEQPELPSQKHPRSQLACRTATHETQAADSARTANKEKRTPLKSFWP